MTEQTSENAYGIIGILEQYPSKMKEAIQETFLS